MPEYVIRDYRNRIKIKDLVSYNVSIKETDLWISTDRDLKKEAEDLVFDARYKLENHINNHPEFLSSLDPVPEDPFAPEIIKDMIRNTKKAGVGPMASVAGAIAQHVAEGLFNHTEQVIIENGGDIYLKVSRDVTVSVFAGKSSLSNRLGIVVPEKMMPLGICSSSGSVGHSLSMGISDVTCILAESAILADGAATALGNKIQSKNDLHEIPKIAGDIEGLLGGIAIVGDEMAVWGDVELTAL
ncbi:UPF0280 family protein [Thermodesulfobacteriota bacterium]